MNRSLYPLHLLLLKFPEFLLVKHQIILPKIMRIAVVSHYHLHYMIFIIGGGFVGEVCFAYRMAALVFGRGLVKSCSGELVDLLHRCVCCGADVS